MDSTVVKGRDDLTSVSSSLSLQHRWKREIKKLRDSLKDRLRRDMQKCLEEKCFTDVTFLIDGEVEIESHSSILKARVGRFFHLCRKFDQLNKQPPIRINLRGVNETELETFLREVYTGENMEKSENVMINRVLASFSDEEIDEVRLNDKENVLEPSEDLDVGARSAIPDPISMETSDNSLVEVPGVSGDDQTLLDLSIDDAEESELQSSKREMHTDDIYSFPNTSDASNLDIVASKDELEETISELHPDSCSFQEERIDSEQDLIKFDENEVRDENLLVTKPLPDTTQFISAFEILNLKTEAPKLVEMTEIGIERVNDDMFSSVLKTSAGQEVLDLKFGSKETMIRSHDSGMCSESYRKLSTSSIGQPTFSPSSENIADSSNESLPKDDSLECCLDSLANDETNESTASGFIGFDLSGTSLPTGSRDGQPLTGFQMSASCPSTSSAEFSSWKSVFEKKCSCIELNDDTMSKFRPCPPRRWSASSGESISGSNKPAAVVLPYNEKVDLQLIKISEISRDSSVDIFEQSQGSTGDLTSSDGNFSRNISGPSSVISFVPYLREVHHIQRPSPTMVDLNQIPNNLTFPNLVTGPVLADENLPLEPIPNLVVDVNKDDDETIAEMRPNVVESDSASAVISQPIAESDASTGLASVDNLCAPANATDDHLLEAPAALTKLESGDCHPPPPVYMFIEAECHSPSHMRPKSAAGRGQLKEGEYTLRDVPLRRKILKGNSFARRPKSETSASLFPPFLDDVDRRKKAANKRVSLTLDDDDAKSTHSLEGPDTMSRLTGESCSKLGDDLLKMFLNEIDSDVTVSVGGKVIRAHKSVLSSRCVYFAAAMSGNWLESAGNVINISGFSYEAVYFAVHHIYSGAAVVPENIDISELASLADMLGFEALKDVVALAMKMKYCHFFHKPCSGCATTVSECFLIAASFGLDEMQEKCLRWINKHMLKTWPTKSFAALPDELLQKCLNASKIEIAAETVLDLTVRCEKLTSTLPRVKWIEPVTSIAQQLSDTCALYLADNLAAVVGSQAFLELRTGHTWTIHALESSLLIAADNCSLNGACKAYVRLHALKIHHEASKAMECESPDINENFELLLNKIHRQVEHFLIHNANRVVRCAGWALLSPELQQRIKDAAVIVFEFGKPTAAPPKLSSQNKKFTKPRTSCSSTASGSPVTFRNKVGVSSKALSKSLHLTLEEKSTNGRNGRNFDKAATLPRTFANKSTVPRKEEPKDLSCSKLKSAQTNRPSSISLASAKIQSCNNQPCISGVQRPKSVTLKERSSSVTTAKVRDKPANKELLNSSKSLIPNSISLRSASGTSSKFSASYRPKTPNCNGTSRVTKLPLSNGKDVHGKENKDETKNAISIRTRADENSRLGLKRNGQRTSLSRGSCSSVVKRRR